MNTLQISSVTTGLQTLMQRHEEELRRIEQIKSRISQPNDDNLDHPVGLFEQIHSTE